MIVGYTIELGYAEEVVEHDNGYKEVKGFEAASVVPFRAGSNVLLDPESPEINEGLGIAPWEAGGESIDMDQYREMPLAVDDDGKAPAVMDVTFNYSKRIGEVIGAHLGDLHGIKAAEGASMLMRLVAGLEPVEGDTDDPWKSTDGNIKNVAEVLLDWTFQHPDAVFYQVV